MNADDGISVERCKLQFECGQAWSALERLPGGERVRFCGRCQSAVHLVEDARAFAAMAAQGKCVAVRFGALPVRVGKAEVALPYPVLRVVGGRGVGGRE